LWAKRPISQADWFLLVWGAQAASLQWSAALPTTTKEDFLASCQKEQAGSLRSPETRELL
jgi:hypothetical protein